MKIKIIILATLFFSNIAQLNASESKEQAISLLSTHIAQLNKTMHDGFSSINFRLANCEKRLQRLETITAPLRQINLTCFCPEQEINSNDVQELVYDAETGTYRSKKQ
ncbi:MAG TPA: hypothetical protein VFF04_03730 [Candidatus Babeliales bacterium]|nr:hypothetical protein [Candidatus Babeliales bacterium]